MSDGNAMVVDENSTTNYSPSILQPADIEASVAIMKNWEKLNNAIIDKDKDIQKIGKKDFKKKSAWRKYALAYNLSDEIIDEKIIYDECHRIISARFKVKCIAPNGRYTTGVASCSIWDKISADDIEEPTPFELRKRFSHAEHDIISTAHTRAKNRAISDMLGVGEVSAEEAGEEQFTTSGKKVSRTSRKTSSESDSNETKTPKRRRRTKKAEPESEIVQEESKIESEKVIDTKAEVVEEDSSSNNNSSKSLEELSDENSTIKKAISRLNEKDEPVSKVGVVDEVFNMFDLGNISMEEYDEATKLLIN